VKFLIDAQLPARLAELLNRAGHDAAHTIGLPNGNRSTDSQIAQRADTDGRVVVTKLFELHLDAIVSALDEADFVELSQDALALGRRREDADG